MNSVSILWFAIGALAGGFGYIALDFIRAWNKPVSADYEDLPYFNENLLDDDIGRSVRDIKFTVGK